MSNQFGICLAGSVVPGVIDPRIRKSFITHTPHGPPAKIQRVEELPKVPHPMGDDKNPNFMDHIKKMGRGELTKPIAEAMPAMRDWR